MKKIICIGECALDIIFRNGSPVGSMPGGRIINAAAILARQGLPVTVLSEIARDPVGDIVAGFLAEAGIDTSSVDRFTEGLTPVNIFTAADNSTDEAVTRYEQYPDNCFDVVWPRIDEDDIIVYGGHYAIDARMHSRMAQLLEYAVERKAVLVYLPGYLPVQEPQITRIKPAILENLEYATLVIARNSDLQTVFGVADSEQCYKRHIDFYCRSLITIDNAADRICYYCGNDVTTASIPGEIATSMMWNSGALAGIMDALYADRQGAARFDEPDETFRRAVIERAVDTAQKTTDVLSADWQKQH